MTTEFSDKEKTLIKVSDVISNIHSIALIFLVITTGIFIYRYFSLETFRTLEDPTGSFQTIFGLFALLVIFVAIIAEVIMESVLIQEVRNQRDLWKGFKWTKWQKLPQHGYFMFLGLSFLIFIFDWFSQWSFAIICAILSYLLVVRALLIIGHKIMRMITGPSARLRHEDEVVEKIIDPLYDPNGPY